MSCLTLRVLLINGECLEHSMPPNLLVRLQSIRDLKACLATADGSVRPGFLVKLFSHNETGIPGEAVRVELSDDSEIP